MRPIGFSTGALAYADFRGALQMLRGMPVHAVELSALREDEWFPLLDSLIHLDLSRFTYVSVHAPSRFSPGFERLAAGRLTEVAARGWPIIVHPDAIADWGPWREIGALLCIENMDKRKPIGRTVAELERIFEMVPAASFCFDIGHARQVDSTMTEAYLLLTAFSQRLVQVHVSEVSTSSKHDRLSFTSALAFRQVSHLIPEQVPLILETPVTTESIMDEIEQVLTALPLSTQRAA